jgi:hypothetical protein
MANRGVNPNLVKLHRTYDVSELARRCGVHKNTVLNWRADGLAPIDGSKPILFHGSAIREFLKKRNGKRKQPCGPGKLFCFRCKQPRAPAFGLADYVSVTATSGNVRAFCDTCETVMHRRVSLSALTVAMPGIDFQNAEAPPRLMGSTPTSLNCDSNRKAAA